MRYRGLQFHLGSQLLGVEPYLEALDTVFELIRTLQERSGAWTRELDEGDVKVPPRTAQDARPPAEQVLAAK